MVNSSAGGSSAPDCQQKCAALSTICNFWDWDGSTCRLHADEGNGAQDASGFSAGRRLCEFKTKQTQCSQMQGQKLQSLKNQDVACDENQVMQSFKLAECSEECKCAGTVIYGRKFVFGKPGSGALTSAAKLMSHAYKHKFSPGSITCSNGAMGGNPAHGYHKYCFCDTNCLWRSSDWLTQENGTGSSSSRLTVKVQKTGSNASRHEIVLAPRITRKMIALTEGKQLWTASYDMLPGDWEVTYKSGDKTCFGPEPLEAVQCSEGFENKDGNCTKKSVCGKVQVGQVAGHTGATNGVLRVSVSGTGTTPQLLLFPVNASQALTVSPRSGGTFRTEDHELKSGAWRLDYRSGDGICNDSIPLNELVCQNGYALDESGRCSHVNGTKDVCELVDVPGVDQTGTKIAAGTTLNIVLKKDEEKVAFERSLKKRAQVRLVRP